MNIIFRTLTILLLILSLSSPCPGKESQQRKLRKEGIRAYEVPIQNQSVEWLTGNFKDNYAKEYYPVNISLMMRNIIWQQRQLIKNKDAAPFKGNLRTFWYTYIKIPLARLGIQKEDHYKLMIGQFVHLVKEEDLMRYKDLGFSDVNKFSKKIGDNHHIILAAEKQGHLPFLLKMHNKYNITVIALGGQPSLLSAEYFVDDLKKRGIDIRQKFYLLTIIDYDPSGLIIRNAFIDDLRFYGIKHLEVTDLIWPNLLAPDILKMRIYPVPDPDNMKTKNQRWLDETGGIEGELYGLESEAIERDMLETLIESKIKPLIKKPRKKQKVLQKR